MPTETADARVALRGLRPQDFGGARGSAIADPIVEPVWTGLRVLAAIAPGSVEIVDEAGGDVTSDDVTGYDDVVAALGEGIAGGSRAVLDGYLTADVHADGTGAFTGDTPIPPKTSVFRQLLLGRRGMGSDEEQQARYEPGLQVPTLEPDQPASFVAVDLLWLDGEWLLDIPLLERKRLLEGLVIESELVRHGMYVRMPIGNWITSWRAQGFPGLAFKAPNSRYRPGERSDEWALARMPAR